MVIQYIMTDIFWSSSHTLQHALPTSHGLKRCLQNQGAAREHHHRDAYPGLCWMALGNGNGALCLTQSWEVLVRHGSLWYQYINMYPYQSYFGPDHHLINGPILKIHSAKPWSKNMPREEGYATSTPTTASLPPTQRQKGKTADVHLQICAACHSIQPKFLFIDLNCLDGLDGRPHLQTQFTHDMPWILQESSGCLGGFTKRSNFALGVKMGKWPACTDFLKSNKCDESPASGMEVVRSSVSWVPQLLPWMVDWSQMVSGYSTKNNVPTCRRPVQHFSSVFKLQRPPQWLSIRSDLSHLWRIKSPRTP